MLQRRYPLHHARDSTHDEVAEKLRRLEKYEIALQGDDYADKDNQKTNHEALAYARAAASVCSMTGIRLSELCAGSKEYAMKRLKQEPYISDFRAVQIVELAKTGTCQALDAFESNQAPFGSDGRLRTAVEGNASRSMAGGHSKLQLSKVLGISATRAAQLWDGGHRGLPSIQSIEQLRLLPPDQSLALSAPLASTAITTLGDVDDDDEHGFGGGGGVLSSGDGPNLSRANFSFGLAHHEELQEPIPVSEAEAMRRVVLRTVRAQQGCQGCACDCTRPFGDLAQRGAHHCVGCDCCWHVDFVGGAPRRGCSGHDVDLLIWHRHKPASWAMEPAGASGVSRPTAEGPAGSTTAVRGSAGGEGRPRRTGSVLGMLLDALEDGYRRNDGGIVGGWQMPRLAHHRRQLVGGVFAHRKPFAAANAESTHGYENLSMDYHDKVFGVWRTPQGKHRRIDLVVNSFPEELALCRLTWIGGRMLNRLIRGYALSNGLWLSAHALLVKNAGQPLVLKDHETGETVMIPKPGEAAPAIVPYKYLRTEKDILYLLAGGTDAFFGLLDARNRNA